MLSSIKNYAKFAAAVMAVIVVTDYVQTNVKKIPVVGKYLPGGGDAPKA